MDDKALRNSAATGVVCSDMVRRWRKAPPRCGGWWLWREGGRDRVDELLLTAGGTAVASDDAWEQATGKPAFHDGWAENFWEGTSTTQKEMPGLWMKAPNTKFRKPSNKPPNENHHLKHACA